MFYLHIHRSDSHRLCILLIHLIIAPPVSATGRRRRGRRRTRPGIAITPGAQVLLPGDRLGLGNRTHYLHLVNDPVGNENRLVGGGSSRGPASSRLRRLRLRLVRLQIAIPGILEDRRKVGLRANRAVLNFQHIPLVGTLALRRVRLLLAELNRHGRLVGLIEGALAPGSIHGGPLVRTLALRRVRLLLAELNRHGRLVGLIEGALAPGTLHPAVKTERRLGRLAVAHAVGAVRANQVSQRQLLPARLVGARRNRNDDGLIVDIHHRVGKLGVAELTGNLAAGTSRNPATVVEGSTGRSRSSVTGDRSVRHLVELS